MKKIKIVPMMLTACLLAGCNPNTTSSDITNTDTSSGTTSSTPTPTKGEILSFDVNESYKEYKSVQLDKIDDIQKDGGDNSKYKRTSFFENKNYFVIFATEISNLICYYINKVKEHKVTDTK